MVFFPLGNGGMRRLEIASKVVDRAAGTRGLCGC